MPLNETHFLSYKPESQLGRPRDTQRQDGSNEKSPFVRTGLQKEKQARFPVPVVYNLAEEGGFEPP